MPIYVLFTLFALSFTLPTLVAIVIWAMKPQSIEALVVQMVFGIGAALAVHMGFALWLLPQYYPTIIAFWPSYIFAVIGNALVIGGCCSEAAKRFSPPEKDKSDDTATATPLRKAN